MLAPATLVIQYGVIAREERYSGGSSARST